jgi:hypothetical protein
MKTRNGFVSNSSSSSFVIIGYPEGKVFPDKEAALKKYAPKLLDSKDCKEYGVDEVWFDFLGKPGLYGNGISHLPNDGPGYIGIILADVSSDGGALGDSKISLDGVMKKIKKFQKLFGIIEPPKIITGTRSC